MQQRKVETLIVRVGMPQAGLLSCVADDVFDAPIDPAQLVAYLAAPGHLMVIALAADLVVGQVRGMIHWHPDQPAELYIDNLGVAPSRRREGVATRLLDELTAWGRSLGCGSVWLGTEVANVAARTLYSGRGLETQTFVLFSGSLEDLP